MRWLLAIPLALALAGGGAAAQTASIERAQDALQRAAAALRDAQGGKARLAALGQAVAAHEAALAAYRDGLRDMAAREGRLVQAMADDGASFEDLFGALQSLSQAPKSALMMFPGGPVTAMRGAGLMGDITPALEAKVADLRARLGNLRQLRAGQEAARVEARGALAALQELRSETAAALRSRRTGTVASREALAAQAEAAAARAANLADLAASLAGAAQTEGGALVSFTEARGLIQLPVRGHVVGGFGDTDPWGRPGQGLTVEAPAYAQVNAPWDGTVRYAGPLIDYGQVVVLEPEPGTLLVLAGLARVDRVVGEIVLRGEPLGDLGGPLPASEEFLLDATTDRDEMATEKLYIELRQEGAAVDPAPWFDLTEKGNGG